MCFLEGKKCVFFLACIFLVKMRVLIFFLLCFLCLVGMGGRGTGRGDHGRGSSFRGRGRSGYGFGRSRGRGRGRAPAFSRGRDFHGGYITADRQGRQFGRDVSSRNWQWSDRDGGDRYRFSSDSGAASARAKFAKVWNMPVPVGRVRSVTTELPKAKPKKFKKIAKSHNVPVPKPRSLFLKSCAMSKWPKQARLV